METNLKKFKKLAPIKENENWEFRRFLKNSDLSSRKIDSIVHKLYREISSKIDCKTCANCCKEMQPVLDEEDIEKLSRGLKVEAVQFEEQYLINNEDQASGKFMFKQKPCPFLVNNSCLCYSYRPKDCKSFPHLYKPDFVSRLINVMENYAVCPIVFHVYEELKNEIWRRRRIFSTMRLHK